MFNKVVMLGNIARDIELRYLPSGNATCTTGIATNRKYKKQDGSQGEEVCFIDVVFFGKMAENVNRYLKKGSKILVEGRLKLDQWTDQQGVKRSKHSIYVETMEMLDGNRQGEQQPNKPPVTYRDAKGNEYDEIPTDIDVNDDEIPF
ncbi:MAG: single-stranded DNA-binding protein [Sulfurospirillum sp.]